MNIATIAAFWTVSMLFVLTPGADWAYAMAAGIRHTNVGWAVAGLLAGHLTATVMVTAGLAALLAASPTAMTVLTVAGAVYLCWLGVTTLRHRHAVATAEMLAPTAGRQLFLKGLGVSLLNPKVFLLFLALLPQFVTPGTGWPVPAQLLTLGALHVLNCAIIYAMVAFGASAVLTARLRPALAVTTLTGIVLIGFGGVLAVEQLAPHLSRIVVP